MLSGFFALLQKDLLNELRGREVVIVHLAVSLLLAAMIGLGLQGAFLTRDQVLGLSPLFIWLVFVFAGAISFTRSFEYELNLRPIDSLLLSGFPPQLIFVSKCLANTLVVLLGHILSILALSMFLNLALVPFVPKLAVLSCAVALGYSALATLLSSLSAGARVRGLMLPVLLLPLLFPLFFGAIEITDIIVAPGAQGEISSWGALIAVFDIVYLVATMNLFEFTIRE